MPVLNTIADHAPELAAWRQLLHSQPETRFDCHKTAAFVAEKLRGFGVDAIHEGIAQSGIVALIHGQRPGRTIALRADMDALPMQEATGLDYASQIPGAMHACGHDGHTTMLLGAARYLAETRNFAGTVALIFQPAEEFGSGAKVMIDEGILERFEIEEVYALHNMPGTPVGEFYASKGAVMAGIDSFTIDIKGRGGHGAYPHETRDPIVAACAIVQAIQTIVSRNNYALDDLVVAVTQFHAGSADNITPEVAMINGTVRSFDPKVQAMVQQRMAEICAGLATSFDVEVVLDYEICEPATINNRACAEKAITAALSVGLAVNEKPPVEMGGEDFAYMLLARPGAYLFIGNGDSANLHHQSFDFNDETTPYGASFFARLVEQVLV
ncbi:MAG: amidohydrolase [Rhodobacteraceae bacterium]|nr:amidohydrolase [Paracoccaceae bacterium]